MWHKQPVLGLRIQKIHLGLFERARHWPSICYHVEYSPSLGRHQFCLVAFARLCMTSTQNEFSTTGRIHLLHPTIPENPHSMFMWRLKFPGFEKISATIPMNIWKILENRRFFVILVLPKVLIHLYPHNHSFTFAVFSCSISLPSM